MSKVHEELVRQILAALGVERTPPLHVDPSHPPANFAIEDRPAGKPCSTQDEKDWEYFCLIFPNKQNILFEYQTISLFR